MYILAVDLSCKFPWYKLDVCKDMFRCVCFTIISATMDTTLVLSNGAFWVVERIVNFNTDYYKRKKISADILNIIDLLSYVKLCIQHDNYMFTPEAGAEYLHFDSLPINEANLLLYYTQM